MKKNLTILFCLLTTVFIHSWGQVVVEASTDSINHKGERIVSVKIKNISKDLTYVFLGELGLLENNRVSVDEDFSNYSKNYLEIELFPRIFHYFLKPNEIYTFHCKLYNQLPNKFMVKVYLFYNVCRFPKNFNTNHIKPKDFSKYKSDEIFDLKYMKLVTD